MHLTLVWGFCCQQDLSERVLFRIIT
jgi:hypothetical protein